MMGVLIDRIQHRVENPKQHGTAYTQTEDIVLKVEEYDAPGSRDNDAMHGCSLTTPHYRPRLIQVSGFPAMLVSTAIHSVFYV